MPHHKSCKKRMRTAEEDRLRNRTYRSQARSLIRQVRESATRPAAEELLSKAAALLDRLASKRIIHKNNAAHYKAKLAHGIKKLPA